MRTKHTLLEMKITHQFEKLLFMSTNDIGAGVIAMFFPFSGIPHIPQTSHGCTSHSFLLLKALEFQSN